MTSNLLKLYIMKGVLTMKRFSVIFRTAEGLQEKEYCANSAKACREELSDLNIVAVTLLPQATAPAALVQHALLNAGISSSLVTDMLDAMERKGLLNENQPKAELQALLDKQQDLYQQYEQERSKQVAATTAKKITVTMQ